MGQGGEGSESADCGISGPAALRRGGRGGAMPPGPETPWRYLQSPSHPTILTLVPSHLFPGRPATLW